MQLAWATDIHLDFCTPQQRADFYAVIRARRPDAVVLTGDLTTAKVFEPILREAAAALAVPVYFVLGNHDFYGSGVAEIRRRAADLTTWDARLRWLPAAGVVELSPDCALVGQDGWCDGRFGDWYGSPVVLNDYLHIADLAEAKLDRRLLLARIQDLAGDSAANARASLRQALGGYERVIFATHVPPFKEACWHEGRMSGPEWLPHFSSKVMGEALLEVAAEFPQRELLVLCGHTHGAGVCRPAANLEVRTGGAVYGNPELQSLISV